MAKPKTLILHFLFLYLVSFPFGQFPRLIFDLLGISPFLHIPDAIILLYASLHIFKARRLPRFLIITIFSYIIAISIWGFYPSGFFYLLRLCCYVIFFTDLANFLSSNKSYKPILVKSLIIVGSIISIFGFFQYFFFPDLRALYFLGWDDHLYRLTSTFLDPAFTGILLVLTLLAVTVFLRSPILFIFNLLALVLTFSRASFISALVSLAFLYFRKTSLKKLAIFIFAFIALIVIVPKPEGIGVNLLRTHSIFAKIDSYKESISFIEKSPVFGVGFNNLCQFRPQSHACSGLDNSFLFILATTGLLGAISLFNSTFKSIKSTSNDNFGALLKASLVAVAIHSLFTNTLFYPWVMGWLGLLYALSRIKGNKSRQL